MFVRGTFDCLISQIIAEFEGSCYNTKASNEPSRRLKFHNHRDGPYWGTGGLVNIDS